MTQLRRPLTTEWGSALVALACAGLLMTGALVALELAGSPLPALPTSLLAWDVWSVVFIVLSIRTYAGRSLRELAGLVNPPGRAGRIRTPRDGPSWAVQMALIALAAAGVLGQSNHVAGSSAERVLTLVAGVLAVATAWTITVVSYAIDYLRRQVAQGGLRFPDGDPALFTDFLYFAIAVQTTFGATDTAVDNARMRRVVTGHSVLAFIFNTVILALLVAALT